MTNENLAVSIIVPTYNERENIPALVEETFSVIRRYPDIDLELIVVDDNSPDGTGQVVESFASRYPIRVIHRPGKMGLGSAVMEGFAESDRDYLGVMDGDLSHDPAVLPLLIESLREYDLTLGSRYHRESRFEQWPWYRRLLSWTGVFFARRLTGVTDPLSGYFFLRRKVLNQMTLTSPGYKILLEILVKGSYSSLCEIPFVFRERRFSSSKMNIREHYLFLKQLVTFRRMVKTGQDYRKNGFRHSACRRKTINGAR